MASLFNIGGSKPRPSTDRPSENKATTTATRTTRPTAIRVKSPVARTVSRGGSSKEMSEKTFNDLRQFIYQECGIYFNNNKKYLLEGRITKRLISLKLTTYDEYLQFLKQDKNRFELDKLFEAITINETFFYRAQQQYEAFENVIIPEIIERKRKNKELRPTIRVWSAASSSGEEAYTLALIIHDRLKRKYPNVNFQILGSDIDTAVLAKARAAKYKDYAIRNVPPNQLKKYFTKKDGVYLLNNEIKQYARFSQVNLFDTVAMRKIVQCDVIFCANVLIYFDTKAKQKVVSHLYNSLNRGGYLFIGYSESLHGVSKAFKLIHLAKAMAYYKE